MKYIKLFEAFSKDYMKKIDLKDFKKIKKGAKLMYMGGKVEVLDNNGYVLKLKGGDDRIFMVNKSQFDHGGMTMRESVNELRSDMISGTSGRRTESLEDRKYELKKDAKGATIGNFSNVTLPKGTNTPPIVAISTSLASLTSINLKLEPSNFKLFNSSTVISLII